jgi:Plasmid pRiA4b ORF-3-like protein
MLLIEGTGGGVSMTQAPVADRSGSIYRLRVVLAGISPLIWRQVEAPDSITIAGLHEVLQVAFGWSGQHLHRFTVRGKEYGICYPGGLIFDDDPHQVRLADLGLRERERFAYAYGFFATLKSWRHDLRVQAIEAPRAGRRYPWCGAGARSAPPKIAVAPVDPPRDLLAGSVRLHSNEGERVLE